jgi:hypothetical protein
MANLPSTLREPGRMTCGPLATGSSSVLVVTSWRLRILEKKQRTNDNVASRSHIGDQGELWFAAALPRGWVWQPPRRDLGKDGLIVVRDGTKLHNLEFSVQIKTSENPRVVDGSVLVSGVKRSSVRYWFASPAPTLVVVVDIVKRQAWYAWHHDLFDPVEKFFELTANTVTIRIPQANELIEAGWASIRNDLFRHFGAIQRALSTDAVAPHVLGTVHSIARITGNLIRLASRAPPELPLTKDEGLTLLIEQIELRDLIQAVRTLIDRLVEGSDGHKQISFWLKSFEETATSGHRSLRALPPKGRDIPPEFELAFAPTLILEARPQLILAAVDLVRLLTSSQEEHDTHQA